VFDQDLENLCSQLQCSKAHLDVMIIFWFLHLLFAGVDSNLMFVGFWWGYLWARQPGWGVIQGQHSNHAAPAWQLDPMDIWHQW
jgi:hypothetical protein